LKLKKFAHFSREKKFVFYVAKIHVAKPKVEKINFSSVYEKKKEN
jgi:hypothetical protein